MNIREQIEQREKIMLSKYATLSVNTLGRKESEIPCDIRTEFQRDRDRILHCKSFRRLKHKTQAFVVPENDHLRTRLTHTLEVSQIARTIARALFLNEDLTEAIALGHDLGHTPFGHVGERVLNRLSPEGFKHNEQSLRIVEFLEKNGEGLNLTFEVRDGILKHRLSYMPLTIEGQIVRFSDKIAYISHDIDDAIRAGVINEDDIPKAFTDVLGHTVRDRLNTMIHDIIYYSQDSDTIRMSDDVMNAMMQSRKWLYDNVYTILLPKSDEDMINDIITSLYRHYIKIMDDQQVCDLIASMTDQYAIETCKALKDKPNA